jgi:SAM-dependent methyltransferase
MNDEAAGSDAPWWRSFFTDDYAAFGLATIDEEATARAVDFIVNVLEIEAGSLLFDQCCGIGRISIPLSQRGIRVIGMDLTAAYVEAARARAAAHDLPCTFCQGDAHEFVAPEPCDAAINWYTSFGYDEDDAQNLRVLERAFESLRSGGRFALDYHATPRIFAEFRATHVDRPAAEGLDNLLLLQETGIDFARGMFHGEWTAVYQDGRRITRPVETRIYMPHEVIALCKRCGFVDIELFGDFDRSPFDRMSRRMIITARRP